MLKEFNKRYVRENKFMNHDGIFIQKKWQRVKTEEITVPLSKLAHSHMERKTFITTALTLGMPVSVVKANTGHSKSSNSFKRYYKIIDSVKDDAMDANFGKL